jgi:hypothetical protein
MDGRIDDSVGSVGKDDLEFMDRQADRCLMVGCFMAFSIWQTKYRKYR